MNCGSCIITNSISISFSHSLGPKKKTNKKAEKHNIIFTVKQWEKQEVSLKKRTFFPSLFAPLKPVDICTICLCEYVEAHTVFSSRFSSAEVRDMRIAAE